MEYGFRGMGLDPYSAKACTGAIEGSLTGNWQEFEKGLKDFRNLSTFFSFQFTHGGDGPALRNVDYFDGRNYSTGFSADAGYYAFKGLNPHGLEVEMKTVSAGMEDYFSLNGLDIQAYAAKQSLTVSQELPGLIGQRNLEAYVKMERLLGGFALSAEFQKNGPEIKGGLGYSSVKFEAGVRRHDED